MFGEKFVDFKDEYFSFYDSIRILFNDSHQVLSEIERLGAKYILVSKNEQNINFFGCKNVFEPSLILICNTSGNKLDVLKRAIKFANTSEVKKISIDQIVVMGDNFWDDIVPAMQLGTRVLWVNKYRSKSKRICNYILRILYKKAMNTSN